MAHSTFGVSRRCACLCRLRENCGVLGEGVLSLWYFEPAWFYSYPEVLRSLDLVGNESRLDNVGVSHRRRNAVVNGVITRFLARTLTGNDLLSLSRDPITGKPFAVQERAFRFNVSHSNNCSLFGAIRCKEVGVDIEEISDVPDAISSTGFFLSDVESAVLQKDAHGYGKSILRLWTLKEAFSKVSGRGVFENFLELNFSNMLLEGVESGFFGGTSLYTPEVDQNVVVSVAVAGTYKSAEIWILRPKSCCFETK